MARDDVELGAGRRTRTFAIALDVAAVVLFVVLGRDAHDGDGGTSDVLTIAAPFLIGVAVAWIASPRLRRRPTSLGGGVDVWVSAVALGLLLRRLVWDRGTALSFVVVTAAVLGVLLLGWRTIRSSTVRRRAVRSPLPPSKAGR